MATRARNPPADTRSYPSRDALYTTNSIKTFVNDEHLPSLPVPSLEQTLSKYLDSVKCMVTAEEYENTLKIVEDFRNGIGAKLHAKLREKADNERNWLEKWWENIAYLSQRTPLLPLCSMSGFTNMENMWPPSIGTQLERASLYLHFQLHFWKLLREEKLKPHTSNNIPWTMHQFKRYFNTVRIPGEIMDRLECHFHTESEEPSSPTHLVILHLGHIFSFDAVDEYGEILTPPEIQFQLQRIQDWCKENGRGTSVGALTLSDRTTWAKNRERLLKIHPENVLHMETIDSALSLVVLDEAQPTDLTGITKETLAGNASDRWADKSIANIIFQSGTIGLISDHTPFDGLVPVISGNFIHSSLIECGGVWKGKNTVERDILPPRRLDFHLDDYLKSAIDESKRLYQIMVDDTDIFAGSFNGYGKSFLKLHNYHPETYAQFALQLAYFTMHGRPAPTYVTAATRKFYRGRTETMRSCYPEVLAWVQAMVEEQKTPGEKLHLMQKAAEKFKQLMKDCSENHGCDRHLLGLYMISIEEGLPLHEIYSDPSWVKSGGSGNFVLSTSCVGYTPLGGCVMPMREDGYGTFYNIENNRFTFTVSAFNRCSETSARKFFSHIEQSLKNMQHLLTSKL